MMRFWTPKLAAAGHRHGLPKTELSNVVTLREAFMGLMEIARQIGATPASGKRPLKYAGRDECDRHHPPDAVETHRYAAVVGDPAIVVVETPQRGIRRVQPRRCASFASLWTA